ncbi:hypothetical protein VP758_000869 [Vibrio harveyi]|nr:hypothetical protein [Vibrio harveyi]
MKKSLLALVVTSLLMGCGGSDGGGHSPQPVSKVQDGIYLSPNSLTMMLVDTEATANSVFIGDYSNNAYFFNDSHVIDGDKLKTTGLHYTVGLGFKYDPKAQGTISFTDSGASMMESVDGYNLLYSFDRTDDSLEYSQLLGTHTNAENGDTWTFEQDGTFTINGICTISGKLHRVKGYFKGTGIQASGCLSPVMNGNDYEARFATVKHDGKYKVLAAMANDSNILWGSVPVKF